MYEIKSFLDNVFWGRRQVHRVENEKHREYSEVILVLCLHNI